MLNEKLEQKLNRYLKKKKALGTIFSFYNALYNAYPDAVCLSIFLEVIHDFQDPEISYLLELKSFEEELFSMDYWDTKFLPVHAKQQEEEITKIVSEDPSTKYIQLLKEQIPSEMYRKPIRIIPEILKCDQAIHYFNILLEDTMPVSKRLKLLSELEQVQFPLDDLNISEDILVLYNQSKQVRSLKKRNQTG